MVPIMEQEYIPEEQCALFIHLHMSQITWAPLVSVVYIICQSGSSLPCPTQTWYQSRHRSQPFAADCIGGINHYFGVRAHQFT